MAPVPVPLYSHETIDHIEARFDEADSDKNGFISVDELLTMLLGDSSNESQRKEVEDVVNAFDTIADGKLSYRAERRESLSAGASPRPPASTALRAALHCRISTAPPIRFLATASGPEVAIYTLEPRSNAFTYHVEHFDPVKQRTAKRALEHDIRAASHLKCGRPEWMYLILEQGKEDQALVQSLVSIDCLLAPAGLQYEDEDGWHEICVGEDAIARLRSLKTEGYSWLATNWREVVDVEVLEEIPGSEQQEVAQSLAPGHVFILVSPRDDIAVHSVQRLTKNVCEVWKVFKRHPSAPSASAATPRSGKLRPVKKLKSSVVRKAAPRWQDAIDEHELQLELQQEEVRQPVEASGDAAAKPTAFVPDHFAHTSWFPPLSMSVSPLPSRSVFAERAFPSLHLKAADGHYQDLDDGRLPTQLPSLQSRSESISVYSA